MGTDSRSIPAFDAMTLERPVINELEHRMIKHVDSTYNRVLDECAYLRLNPSGSGRHTSHD